MQAEFEQAHRQPLRLTLGTDSQERKDAPIMRGPLRYFPAAIAGVARVCKAGNDKHNPGEEMHHARGKSSDHGDCIVRHLMDIQDILALIERNGEKFRPDVGAALLSEASQLAWRALALSQDLHERFGGAPLAPGARLPVSPPALDPSHGDPNAARYAKPSTAAPLGDRTRGT